MLEKAEEIIKESQELEAKLQDSTVISNNKLFQEVSTSYAELSTTAEKAKELVRLHKEIEDVKVLQKNETDHDMKDLLVSELETLEETYGNAEKELEELTKPKDPNGHRDAIIEIRSGTGGEEAALFCADLHRMYVKYAESQGWGVQQLSAHYSANGGFKEVIISIIGKGAYGKLKFESGVHRVQRVPATESSGRIHTSAASVVVLADIEDIPEIVINDSDIRIDVYRSTGPGGQSVNTTDSAVRITHLPTGIVVTCQDEKSQHKNKARAMSILKSKLYQIQQEELQEKESNLRQSAIKGGDRSVKIRTYNFPDGRVTDHRIKQTWHNLPDILNGNIEEILIQTSDILSA